MQKIELKVHQLEKIVENNEECERAYKENDTKCNLNEEKKNDEVNEDNVWKKSRKIIRQYFRNNFPTLVINPVKGRMIIYTSSLIRFMNIYSKYIRPKIKAHTHQKVGELFMFICPKKFIIFNDMQSKELVQNLSKDDNEVQFIIPKCCIFPKSYQKKKK
ncbi:hypothetical protein RFI_01906 [Reticulomyxa filosa]|uniref:Uncharacterized protein n=1 Tax=Reticulomyxa filosa TaxID=46433 RepID=X6PAI7_RETFI|nr:hypothetical protein RFI_01906 [Reticulomyxa filosa]|eukprot:ETO35171.1 hypothetical protein RFI_01906 [Reticulomyxa filosa]